jgi:hypothetical protein
MKMVSEDRASIYYIADRPKGKSNGIRFGRAVGAIGFVSGTPAAEQVHPIRFEVFDAGPAHPPVRRDDLPPILQNVLGDLRDEHPEIEELLAGTLTFEDALRARC